MDILPNPLFTNQALFAQPIPALVINYPAHYTVGGIETIDFIEAKKLNFNLGNVIKYITRTNHKKNTLEDLIAMKLPKRQNFWKRPTSGNDTFYYYQRKAKGGI